MKLNLFAFACYSALATLSLNTQAAPDVKPGLWEHTTTLDAKDFAALKAQINAGRAEAEKSLRDAMAKMPPEQRKQMEAVMAQAGKTSETPAISAESLRALGSNGEKVSQLQNFMATGTNTTKTCVTQNDIDKALMSQSDQEQGCKTKSSHSGNQFKVVSDCGTEPYQSHSESDITVIDPKNVKGTLVQTGLNGNKATPVHMTFTGKWLSSDCGKYAEETAAFGADDEEELKKAVNEMSGSSK